MNSTSPEIASSQTKIRIEKKIKTNEEISEFDYFRMYVEIQSIVLMKSNIFSL